MIRALFLASLLSLPCVAHATGIYQTHYGYSFETITCVPRLAFVICDDGCTAGPPLMRGPKAVTLSARVSQGDTGERNLPGMSSPASSTMKVETSQQPIAHEKPEPPPPRQGWALKRTSVLFALDSFTIEASQEAKLSAFVAEAKDRKDIFVSIEGYTCDLGSQAHNDALARKRAETVASYIEKAGIHPARVTGAGKCCYTTEDPSRRSLNRRVEITVSTGENR